MCSNKPYVSLRPSQTTGERTYYEKSTRNVPDGKGYTNNYLRYGTVYRDGHCYNVGCDDFKKKQNALNPSRMFSRDILLN